MTRRIVEAVFGATSSCVFCHLGTVPGLFCHRPDNSYQHSGWIMNRFQCSHHSVCQSVVLRSSHRINFLSVEEAFHDTSNAMTNSKLILQRITAEVIALCFCTITPFKTMVEEKFKTRKGTCVANKPQKSGVIEKFSETSTEGVGGVRRKHRKAHDPLPALSLEGRPALLLK